MAGVIPRGEGRPTPLTAREIRNLRARREAARLAAIAKKAEADRKKAAAALAAARRRARRLEALRRAREEREAAAEELRQAELAAARAEKAASDAAARAARAQRRVSLQSSRQSDQFRALGLTAEGQQRIPSTQALKRRLGTLRDQLKGTVLDTPKTAEQLARIARVLSGKFGKVGRDVRAAIQQMFADIAGAFDQGGKQGPLTQTTSIRSKKLLAGIGLSPDEIRELRGRLSSFNSAGLAPAGSRNRPSGGGFTGGTGFVIENNLTVTIDGQKIAAIITRHQQKQKRRNPKQKRGPNRRR